MKTYKLATVNDIAIHIDQGCQAKDLSRVRMRIYEDGVKDRSHTTKSYAEIIGNQLRWTQSFSFRYTGQSKVSFETYCEHQFGYQLHELQVLYQGVYYLSNEMFFRRDSCHVYTPEGEKMGVLKWQVRVESREEVNQQVEEAKLVKPLVREDLIGLIKIEGAALEVVNPLFNKRKYNQIELKVKFGDQTYSYNQLIDLSWKIPEFKLEYVPGGSHIITFELLHQGRTIMQGNTSCQNMYKLKRYIKHRVSLFNKNGIKLAVLVVEYRFVQKNQLLDLLYSPNCKINTTAIERAKSTDIPHHIHNKKITNNSNNTANNNNTNKHHSLFQQLKGKTSRYQIAYLMNHNSDILLPKAARFPNSQPGSPRVSYIDPQHNSDFSPSSKRGWHISGGGKFDFTRQYRGNPGVGSYKLPSIWSKY